MINSHKRSWLNSTVAGAGVTSALGDFCYETATAILPGFFAVLGIPPAVLGTVEGLANATSSVTKLFAGHWADKLGRRKLLVLLGYGATPVGQVLVALAVGWPLILFGRVLGWFGKGVRGPLRDAIMAQAIDPETKGKAFGFHRAADSVGAVLGPLLGVVLLGVFQGALPKADDAFRWVLWISVIPGVLSVLAFLVMVNDPETSPNPTRKLFASIAALPKTFKKYLGAQAVFGLGDFSHSLLILAATMVLTPRLGLAQAAQTAALLYVVRNLVETLASYPIGALADRFGHRRVLLTGYALGVVTAWAVAMVFLLNLDDVPALGGIFVLAGLYVAVQETLEPTVAIEITDRKSLTTGYGALGLVNGVTQFVSSSFLGLLWTVVSPLVAFGWAMLQMAAGTWLFSRLRYR